MTARAPLRLCSLLLAGAAMAALLGLTGCATDGGYGYGYDYDYVGPEYVGPDVGFDSGFWGPDYYIGPGYFPGPYGERGHDHDHDHDHPHFHPYRPAPSGRPPPSLPHGFPHGGGVPRAGGGFHGRGVGPHH
ncbi:MAG TPA: hypothetical protein VMF64_06825 [Steroidobacteraceae bacterium]|nr:hypothetical protein [Steroidobacteraceae bacterium]